MCINKIKLIILFRNALKDLDFIFKKKTLTHLSLASLLWDIANRIAPDVTPQSTASHLGLFCLRREFSLRSSKNWIKFRNHS